MARVGKGDLREELEHTLQGRVCLMGVGNPEYGDDAFGVRLAEELLKVGVPDVIVAGSSPESWVGFAADKEFDHLVFLDAVELAAAPGSVVFLDSQEITARYPQISTHKISLGVLANVVESSGFTRAWLLGVQPASLKEGQDLTPTVRRTLGVLLELLLNRRTEEMSLC